MDAQRLAADAPDLARVLALNNAHALETSELDLPRLRRMIGEAFLAAAIDIDGALLLAFDQTADYDSPNFLWFRTRYDCFVYVDRVIVAASHRRRGLGEHLYRDLFAAARAAGHARIVCEVNSDPPNPGSDAFHAALGFREVGRAALANGKTVRYLACDLT